MKCAHYRQIVLAGIRSVAEIQTLTLLLLASACTTLEDKNNCKVLDTLKSTYIYVDTIELMHPEAASQFFPSLNQLILNAKPKTKFRILVDSEFLPQMVIDRKSDPADPFADPFAKSLREVKAERLNMLESSQFMTVYDFLKLFCDLTGTQLVIEKDKVLIMPKGPCPTSQKGSN